MNVILIAISGIGHSTNVSINAQILIKQYFFNILNSIMRSFSVKTAKLSFTISSAQEKIVKDYSKFTKNNICSVTK